MIALSKLARSTGFRLAILYTLAFMVSVALIGLVTVIAVTDALESQARSRLEAELGALVDEFNHGGRVDLDAALAGRFINADVRHRYVIIEPDGRPSSGDASLVGLAASPGSPLASDAGKNAQVPFLGQRTLGDGSRIVVADDLAEVRAIETVVKSAFLLALGIAALLGLVTGMLLSGALLRRVEAVTRTAEAVIDGDFARRIPTTGAGDEFDRLATTINRMLDQISRLLDNLRQVSSDVAHDLRTPLSRLRQGLEAVNRPATTLSAYRDSVTRAIGETDEILAIFTALLRIAQIEGGSRRAAFRQTDMSALLRRVAEAYAASIDEGGRSLTTRIADGVSMDGDAELLVQLFANLIENGLQHTPVGTRIVLSLENRAGTVRCEMADDGPGIPEHERGKVFERFYRLDRSRHSAGHGLGLSLVAAIADLHRGRITLEDNGPGLRVTITFASEPASIELQGASNPDPDGCD